MILRRLLILGFLTIASGCGKLSVVEPGRIERTPATLRFGLTSYLSPADVHRAFINNPKAIVEDYPAPPRGSCPRFDVLTLSFSGVQDLNNLGEINVSFINGKLHSVHFFPNDPDAYLSALAQSGFTFDSKGEFHPSSHVRGWAYTSHDGRRYIAWEDERLRDEINDWIIDCS